MFTRKTQFYNFPQYVSSDVPTILHDFNNFFAGLDNILHTLDENGSASSSDISELRNDADELMTKVATLESNLDTVTTLANNLNTQVNDPDTGLVKIVASLTDRVIALEHKVH